VLQLYLPSRPELAYQLTYSPDPINIKTVTLGEAPDLLDAALQDSHQLTALLGKQKELRTILEAVRKSKPGPGREDPKGKGKKKEENNGGAPGGADDEV